MNIEAAYFDIDDTLLPRGEKEPSAKVLAAVLSVPKRGLNTFRSIGSASSPVEKFGVNLPTICMLGTQVWDTENNLIMSYSIPNEVTTDIVSFGTDQLRDIKIARVFDSESRKVISYFKDASEIAAYSEKRKTMYFPNITTDSYEEFVKLVSDVKICMLQFKSFTGPFVIPEGLSKQVETYSPRDADITFTPKGSGKTAALLWVCNQLNIDPQKVLTAGDNLITDSNLFKHTYGVSVGSVELPGSQKHVGGPEELAEFLLTIF